MGARVFVVEVLELPFPPHRPCPVERSALGTFAECPLCGDDLVPEHAHFRCSACGWRDSCCD